MANIKLPISEIKSIDYSNKAYPFEAKGYGDSGHASSGSVSRPHHAKPKKAVVKVTIKRKKQESKKGRGKRGKKRGGDVGYATNPAMEQARIAQFVASMGGKANMPGFSNASNLSALPGYNGMTTIPSSAIPTSVTGQQSKF